MKKFNKYGKGIKVVAVILLMLSMIGFVGGVYLINYLEENEIYDESTNYYNSYYCLDKTDDVTNNIFYNYFYLSQLKDPDEGEKYRLQAYSKKFQKENTNIFFQLTDEKGNVLLSNMTGEVANTIDFGTQLSYTYSDTDLFDERETKDSIEDRYLLFAYIRNPIIEKDSFFESYQLFRILHAIRYPVFGLLALSAILFFGMLYMLVCLAGRTESSDIKLSWRDKIPIDIYLIGIGSSIVFLFYFDSRIRYRLGYRAEISSMIIGAICLILLLLSCITTFAVRVKRGKWWENSVIYGLWNHFLRITKVLISVYSQRVSIVWKILLGFLVYAILNLFFVLAIYDSYYYGSYLYIRLFILALFNLVAAAVLCYLGVGMAILKQGGCRVSQGDYNYKIQTNYLFGDLKKHAETLNNIGQGMSLAVEERLKSERFKAELITNVSHDIKTPLTSIVNYVDLLKKETIENENAVSFIQVLDKQADRLKKMIEDLIEASKASTGNIPVELQEIDLIELMNQSLGEYKERFKDAHLHVCLQMPEKDTLIHADGKLLWRVLDNLLNNICKYSMPETRIYLIITKSNNKVSITLKNISKFVLNISSEELQERFVRGDTSRNTEGSGLGLAIAKSLTELQQGSFSIFVDGDLFKTIIEFDQMI